MWRKKSARFGLRVAERATKRARLRFQFPIIFGSKRSGHSSRLKMLTTNGESPLVGHYHVNRPRWRFTTLARDSRSHSQLLKVRLASRSQRIVLLKVSPRSSSGNTLENTRPRNPRDRSIPLRILYLDTDPQDLSSLRKNENYLFLAVFSSVSERCLTTRRDSFQGHECCSKNCDVFLFSFSFFFSTRV